MQFHDNHIRTPRHNWSRSCVLDGAIELSASSKIVPYQKIQSAFPLTPRVSLIRPHDHSSEDLFGSKPRCSERSKTRTVAKPRQHSSLNLNLNLTTKPKQSTKTRPTTAMTPRQKKLNQLQSSIFSHLQHTEPVEKPKVKKQRPTRHVPSKSMSKPSITFNSNELKGLIFNVPKIKEAKNPQIENIEISGLKPHEDDFSVKQMCKGIHVISVTTDIDNITGKCKGKARLSVRQHPHNKKFEKLKLDLTQKGLTLKSASPPKGKKNNYLMLSNHNFLDRRIEKETRKANWKTRKLYTSRNFNKDSSKIPCFTPLRPCNK